MTASEQRREQTFHGRGHGGTEGSRDRLKRGAQDSRRSGRRRRPGTCSHGLSESPGSLGPRIRLLPPPTCGRHAPALGDQHLGQSARGSARPRGAAWGSGALPQGPAAAKVEEEGAKREGAGDGSECASAGPTQSDRRPLRGRSGGGGGRGRTNPGSRPPGTLLRPRCYRSAPSRLAGSRGRLWDCESCGPVGLRRPPAAGLHFPGSHATPRVFWELWSSAGRARARREAAGTPCPTMQRGDRGGRGFERRVSRPR